MDLNQFRAEGNESETWRFLFERSETRRFPFYIVTYYIKWVTTSWTYSTIVLHHKVNIYIMNNRWPATVSRGCGVPSRRRAASLSLSVWVKSQESRESRIPHSHTVLPALLGGSPPARYTQPIHLTLSLPRARSLHRGKLPDLSSLQVWKL